MKNYRLNIWFAAIFISLFFGDCKNTNEKNSESTTEITEKTPSKAMYFDWINAEWPGANENKVLANLDFFKWMKEEYGMQLDIYHWDAGNIDRSPSWIHEEPVYEKAVKLAYGSFDSEHFKRQYPNGLRPLVKKADEIGARMGVWLGPDGWGETEEDAAKRKELLVSFCRDYNLQIFKFDAAVTGIRPEKEKYLINALKECRKYTPDLIALNHRIKLSEEGQKLMTTWLWEGKETYNDVHIWNEMPAPHHRAGALSRGLPPNLSRLTEDHGVCISSCLDYWEDDLILQAFNRNLILAPEIYGNPWLLRDNEFSPMARIYNLHRKYNEILVDGMILPEEKYGPFAVSRGDGNTRLITLRNLSWDKKNVSLKLNEETGITSDKKILVKQLHPTEKVIGVFEKGTDAEITLEPFRSSLVLVTTSVKDEFSVEGIDYQVVNEAKGKPVEIDLLAFPGETKPIRINRGTYKFKEAKIDGIASPGLLKGNQIDVKYDGVPLQNNYHRKLTDLKKTAIPADADALYEVTAFTADNNALEVRSLRRSGPTVILQVEKAREMFFNDPEFWKKGIWDKYAFDNDTSTSFKVREYKLKNVRVKPGALRINFGEPLSVDRIVLKNVVDTFRVTNAEFSADLVNWKSVPLKRQGKDIVINPGKNQQLQYLKIDKTPLSISEIEVFSNGKRIPASDFWQVSNLFPSKKEIKVESCWNSTFVLDEIAKNSYLCVAIPGNYGNEGAWAALKIDGKYVGSPDRSPSFESNHWEHVVKRVDGNYTYYFPLTENLKGKTIEAFVLGLTAQTKELVPEVWITSYPVPFVKKKLLLYEN